MKKLESPTPTFKAIDVSAGVQRGHMALYNPGLEYRMATALMPYYFQFIHEVGTDHENRWLEV